MTSSASTSTSTTRSTSSTRMALQQLSSSNLNARLLTMSFSSNLKKIIYRTPQLKRSLTVDVASLASSNKRPRLDIPLDKLPSAQRSVVPNRHHQASVLKLRLQLAYYKIKHQKTQLSCNELLKSLEHRSLLTSHTGAHQGAKNTPNKKTELLAASTPIPVSIFKSSKNGTNTKLHSFKSVSFQTSLPNLKHPALHSQQSFTTSSPSKFASNVPSSKRTLKAPELKKPNLVKLPSLAEIQPRKPELNNLRSKSLALPEPQHQLLTPIKKSSKTRLKNNDDDSTQLMSSPSKLMTTPSSMGAAKCLLQLAFVDKE